jgi:tRNA-dihydrouridine synthase
VLVEFFEETARLQGERTTVLQMRKFAGMYLRGFPGARRLREQIQSMCTRQEFHDVIDRVFAEGAPEPLVPDHARIPGGDADPEDRGDGP